MEVDLVLFCVRCDVGILYTVEAGCKRGGGGLRSRKYQISAIYTR